MHQFKQRNKENPGAASELAWEIIINFITCYRVQKNPGFLKTHLFFVGFVGFGALLGFLDFLIWASSWEACWLVWLIS